MTKPRGFFLRILDLWSYPRAILILVFGILSTLSLSALVVAIGMVFRSQRFFDVVVKTLWSKPLVWLAGVRVEIRGAENIKTSGKGFLILFNHSSLWDIPVLYGYFPRSFRFGAKIELFKIPFFGKAMEACGVLPIDRANRGKVMKVYEQAISRVQNGECFALAPEGTRQDSRQLGKFKRGPFEFALNAGMDIVPVIVAGVLDVLPKHTFFVNVGRVRRTVIVGIAPPVKASDYSMETMDQLVETVRSRMEPMFHQLNSELSGF